MKMGQKREEKKGRWKEKEREESDKEDRECEEMKGLGKGKEGMEGMEGGATPVPRRDELGARPMYGTPTSLPFTTSPPTTIPPTTVPPTTTSSRSFSNNSDGDGINGDSGSSVGDMLHQLPILRRALLILQATGELADSEDSDSIVAQGKSLLASFYQYRADLRLYRALNCARYASVYGMSVTMEVESAIRYDGGGGGGTEIVGDDGRRDNDNDNDDDDDDDGKIINTLHTALTQAIHEHASTTTINQAQTFLEKLHHSREKQRQARSLLRSAVTMRERELIEGALLLQKEVGVRTSCEEIETAIQVMGECADKMFCKRSSHSQSP